jgi:hypothetical protein
MSIAEAALLRPNAHIAAQTYRSRNTKRFGPESRPKIKARVAETEQTLKDRLARERSQAETQAKAAIEKVRRDTAKAAEARIKALPLGVSADKQDVASKGLEKLS